MEIYPGIQTLLSERLALPADSIGPQARLFDDLGVDSLDLLDLTFLLEKRFGVKLRDSGLDRLLKAELPPGGYLAPEDVAALRPWLPAMRQLPDPDRVTVSQVFSCVTVESLALLVRSKKGES